MYYYGARYYDPRISIFVSVDPLAEQTMEPYLYTGNNPIMFTDPTGMSKIGPPNLNNIRNVNNVLGGKNWIQYGSEIPTRYMYLFTTMKGNRECAEYARYQVAQGGNIVAQGSNNRIDMYYRPNSQTDKSKLNVQKGIDIINENLEQGRAVMAGVSYKDVSTGDNPNRSTNHFVTIVGSGKDDSGTYFSYIDNYGDRDVGANLNENRMYYNNDIGGFIDDTNTPIGSPYILSEIRDNTVKPEQSKELSPRDKVIIDSYRDLKINH